MAAKSDPSKKMHFWPLLLRIFIVIIFLIGGFLIFCKAGQLEDILHVLRDADGGWIIIGLITTALSYTMAGVTQYTAGNWRGSFHKIHLIQWAGNFVNRFLPLNVGSMAMVVRHYRKQGRSSAEAVTVAALPSIVGFAKNLIPVIILSPFTIAHILNRYPISLPPIWLYPVAAVVMAVLLFVIKTHRKKVQSFLREARGGLSSMKSPWQMAVLISASVAFTLLASASLFAAVSAVGAHLPLPDIFTLYILSVFAGSIVPTPGGIGGPEAALIAGLTSLGVGFSDAVSITLLFRLMTFWAPLVPGAVALYLFRKHTN